MTTRVTYSLVPVIAQPNGVKQNTKFDVILYAKDERLPATYTYNGAKAACPRGVFAAYLNIYADPGVLKINGVEFNGRFPNGRIYRDNGGVFLGALGGVALGGGPVRAEVCRIKFQTLSLYTPENFSTVVSMNVAGLAKPLYDTLVYGMEINLARELNMPNEISYIDPGEIAFQSLPVTILGEQ